MSSCCIIALTSRRADLKVDRPSLLLHGQHMTDRLPQARESWSCHALCGWPTAVGLSSTFMLGRGGVHPSSSALPMRIASNSTPTPLSILLFRQCRKSASFRLFAVLKERPSESSRRETQNKLRARDSTFDRDVM